MTSCEMLVESITACLARECPALLARVAIEKCKSDLLKVTSTFVQNMSMLHFTDVCCLISLAVTEEILVGVASRSFCCRVLGLRVARLSRVDNSSWCSLLSALGDLLPSIMAGQSDEVASPSLCFQPS